MMWCVCGNICPVTFSGENEKVHYSMFCLHQMSDRQALTCHCQRLNILLINEHCYSVGGLLVSNYNYGCAEYIFCFSSVFDKKNSGSFAMSLRISVRIL